MSTRFFRLALLLGLAPASLYAGERQLAFTGSTVTFSGKAFRLPCAKDALLSAFGTPDRVERLANDIYVWDELGLFAYVRPGRNEAFSVNVALGEMTKFLSFAPKKTFTGPLIVDGARITPAADIDTINKSKKGQPFRADFVRYSFRAEEDGFCCFLNRGTPAGFAEGGPFIEFSLEWTGKK